MDINVKLMQGRDSRECTVQVTSHMSITSLKDIIASKLIIPASRQKLVFKGKTLSDDSTIGDYGIVSGNKIFLFTKTEAGSKHNPRALWIAMETLLKKHFTPADAQLVLEQLKKDFSNMIANLSLDDIERIAKSNRNSQISSSIR